MDEASSTDPLAPLVTAVRQLRRQVVKTRTELPALPEGYCWEECSDSQPEGHAYRMSTSWAPVKITDRPKPGCTRFIPKRPHQREEP